MKKFTAGPWRICDPTDGNEVLSAGGQTIAIVENWNTEGAVSRLIAAAPELLAACRAMMAIEAIWLPAVADEEHVGEAQALHAARGKILAAIARATGEVEK